MIYLLVELLRYYTVTTFHVGLMAVAYARAPKYRVPDTAPHDTEKIKYGSVQREKRNGHCLP